MRNLSVILYSIIMSVFLFSSCNSDNDESDKVEIVTLVVAPKTTTIVSPTDLEEEEWLVVKENNKSFALPLKWIKDFEYEEGFEYKLQVKKVTPSNKIQDAPQSFYYLIEILSKEKSE